MMEKKSDATDALVLLSNTLPLHNDFDAYILEIVEWGLGMNKKPKPEDYGLPKKG